MVPIPIFIIIFLKAVLFYCLNITFLHICNSLLLVLTVVLLWIVNYIGNFELSPYTRIIIPTDDDDDILGVGPVRVRVPVAD